MHAIDGRTKPELPAVRALQGDVGQAIPAWLRRFWGEDQADAERCRAGDYGPPVSSVREVSEDQRMSTRTQCHGCVIGGLHNTDQRQGRHRNTPAALAVLSAISLIYFAGCDAREPAEEVAEDVAPELPAIGGVQDVWEFPFGFDSSRDEVRAAYGVPDTVTAAPVVEGDDAPVVEEWQYDGVLVVFYLDEEQEYDFVVSVEVDSSTISLGGGLSVEMATDGARRVLGEPGLDTGRSLVYFYMTTTIELAYEQEIVTAIVLSRALP